MKHILFAIICVALAIPAKAVTDKEMEEARTITAQAYLRYANDGSGYLDDFKATSMSELESKLKAKEKENIKAFKSVKVPSDYASWDKARLLEFWAVTFFTSPNLADKGKVARSRVRQRISAMTVADPVAAAPKEVKKEGPAPAAEPASAVSEESPATAGTPLPSAEEAEEKQEEILADQNAIAQDAEEKQFRKEDSGTWIYVLVLIVLVGIVVWLVVFAANMMKKQAEPLATRPSSSDSDSEKKLREQFTKAMGKKNDELAQTAAALEASEKDNARLMDSNDTLKAEIARLKTEIASLRAGISAAGEAGVKPATPRSEQRRSAEMPNVIYLGRANRQGVFVRADRRIAPGNTIYRLDTRDGLVGTFHVVDDPEITDFALSNPVEYLSGGCTALDIDNTDGVTAIVTENAGTAIFENGCWKVLRKSRIRYE